MKLFINENKLFLFLIFLFFISELIVNPIGNFPLNDDWSYGKSGLLFYNTTKINIGDFPAMTLFTHLVWGGFFTKIFGFSFTVLRFSTLISAVIAMWFLNKLIFNITGNKSVAFVVCLSLLFNPIYFNLANTYMTDVSFNTLIIMCAYFAHDFFKNKKMFSFLMVFICSALLVLIRQFGIIVPLCFAFSCLFLKEQKWKYILLATLGTVFVFAVFKYYENFLKGVLDQNATYKFSGNVSVTKRFFWDTVVMYMQQRHVTVMVHIFVYAVPLLLIFVGGIFKQFKVLAIIFVSCIAVVVVFHIFKDERFPIGNIFSNTNLGAETFFETLHPHFQSPQAHTWSESANEFAAAIKYGFIWLAVVVITFLLLKLFQLGKSPIPDNPFVVFLGAFFLAYIFLLFVPESFTDRYHLPLITITLIALSYAHSYFKIIYWPAALPLILFAFISVAGTKDYLELNRTRWQAYSFLKNDLHIDHKQINGGFEVNCWNEGEKCVWYDFLDLKNYNFLIQYRQEPGFRTLRTYEFQRYLPYKKDKIYIFINELKKSPKAQD